MREEKKKTKEQDSGIQEMAIDVAFKLLIIVGDSKVKKNSKIVLKASLRKAIQIHIIVTFNSISPGG